MSSVDTNVLFRWLMLAKSFSHYPFDPEESSSSLSYSSYGTSTTEEGFVESISVPEKISQISTIRPIRPNRQIDQIDQIEDCSSASSNNSTISSLGSEWDESDLISICGSVKSPSFPTDLAESPRLLGLRGPLVIAVEGPPGVGVTSVCEKLSYDLLCKHGLRTKIVAGLDAEASERPSSPRLAALQEGQVLAPIVTQHVVRVLNRIEMWDNLTREALQEGISRSPQVILVDRYTLTGLAEAHFDGCAKKIARLQETFCPVPSLTLYLHASTPTLALRQGRQLNSGTSVRAVRYEQVMEKAREDSSRLQHLGVIAEIRTDRRTLRDIVSHATALIVGLNAYANGP